MFKLAFAVLGLLVLAIPAQAQVVVVPPLVAKGPVYTNPCTPTSCTGIYVGGGLGGVGTNLDILGNGISNSVFASGGVPFLDLGYQFANGSYFFAGEVGIGDQFSTNANVAGIAGNQNGILGYEIAKAGMQLSGLLGTQAAITIPTTLTQNLISPYVLAGAVERTFANGWATGAGATFDLSPTLFLDIRYMYINYGASTNGSTQMGPENLVTVGLNYKFKY